MANAGPESEHIMGDTQYTLEHKAKISRKKQEGLKQEWDAEVFEKIQARYVTSS